VAEREEMESTNCFPSALYGYASASYYQSEILFRASFSKLRKLL